MTKLIKYSYVVLRYQHDTVTKEFVNIGILVFSPEGRFLKGRYTDRIKRMTSFFPDIDRESFRMTIKSIKSATRTLSLQNNIYDLLSSELTAENLAVRLILKDDSALQWSNLLGGITTDLEKTTEHLFERFVTRYQEEKVTHRRSDQEIFSNLVSKINAKNISSSFKEKIIKNDTDEIDFKLAWKNGVWHCIQPLSLDLSDSDHIRDKARRWAGHLLAVSDTREKFIPYFVVAKPKSNALHKEFDKAISILKKSPIHPEIIMEENSDCFVSALAEKISGHV